MCTTKDSFFTQDDRKERFGGGTIEATFFEVTAALPDTNSFFLDGH